MAANLMSNRRPATQPHAILPSPTNAEGAPMRDSTTFAYITAIGGFPVLGNCTLKMLSVEACSTRPVHSNLVTKPVATVLCPSRTLKRCPTSKASGL